MTLPNITFTDEELEFLLDYLQPVLDDEDDGAIAFSISRKIYSMRQLKDKYGL